MYEKLLSEVKTKVLENDETLLAAIYGQYSYPFAGVGGRRQGILAATNKQIIFYCHYMKTEIIEKYPYEVIQKINKEKSYIGHNEKVSFFHEGTKESMSLIQKGDIDSFVKAVKNQIKTASAD
ncbi:hypothetical protein JOD45_000828 [Scopulibacillus daqui]|uniref:YokE-like PH domain-containing protein n=1 Tax=Scopulibacillus daqui TaxID=1469162 RepID=A0ABS2PY52_9BACL|nr:PH domain-containing protein [Scopulibacillus daqui]MBM7644635.1 hypothetical protein [Scopulibacillus daqui]